MSDDAEHLARLTYLGTPAELGSVEDDAGVEVKVYREIDGSVVLWAPDIGWSERFLPAELGKLRELLDRAAMPGQPGAEAEAAAPTAERRATDPFGGHEFAYESSTDLFRCTRCRAYEVTVRDGEAIQPCPGDVPGEPMELNAY